MRRLTLAQVPTRIVLGAGASALIEEELAELGARRAVILCTPTRRIEAERVAARLDECSAGVLAIAEEHVPLEVASRGRKEALERRADALVAVGGGSTVGLAKAIALEVALPIIAIPTTYAGSEMTPIWGMTEAGVKRTGRDERVRATSVLYDPVLSLTLPPHIAVPSAFNGLAHAVEALYAFDADAAVLEWAEEAIRALAASLPMLATATREVETGERALHGACLSGACIGRASMGLHHRLCHVLGGSFGLPHAETHAALLPYVARFNLEACPEARARLATALGTADPARGLFDLAQASGVRLGLAALGLPHAALERVVELATTSPYPNPREVTPSALRSLLEQAHAGTRLQG